VSHPEEGKKKHTLTRHLESSNMIIKEQAGFCICRSKEDQIAYVVQETKAIEDQQNTYDQVWWDGMLLKCVKNCVKRQCFY